MFSVFVLSVTSLCTVPYFVLHILPGYESCSVSSAPWGICGGGRLNESNVNSNAHEHTKQ